MSKKNVYLSAGHCGTNEVGAKSKALNEKQAAAELVAMVANESRMLTGLKIRVDALALADRVKEANTFCGNKSGVAIEIHFNAGGGTGCEAVVSNNASSVSLKIADDLSKLTSDTLSIKNRGVKRVSQSGRTKLAYVDDTWCPAVILEVCFVDSTQDCIAYAAAKGQLAYALAAYIDNIYF